MTALYQRAAARRITRRGELLRLALANNEWESRGLTVREVERIWRLTPGRLRNWRANQARKGDL